MYSGANNMIINKKNMNDYEAYIALPRGDRWIMNKLMLAESLGYNCGPVGVPIDTPGTYCIRPIMNLSGGGNPGFFKYVVEEVGVNNMPKTPGGYFWCEWFEGESIGVDYEDDMPVQAFGGIADSGGNHPTYGDHPARPPLPASLTNKSKYLTVEYIGDKIIEVTPRWQWKVDGMNLIQNADKSYRWEYPNERPQL
jgi:hypothetical protein